MLSKIAYNQRKAKNRLLILPAAKNAKNESAQANKKDQKND
ncbi:hypothetical protein ID0498_15610 [Helicobacter pylori]